MGNQIAKDSAWHNDNGRFVVATGGDISCDKDVASSSDYNHRRSLPEEEDERSSITPLSDMSTTTTTSSPPPPRDSSTAELTSQHPHCWSCSLFKRPTKIFESVQDYETATTYSSTDGSDNDDDDDVVVSCSSAWRTAGKRKARINSWLSFPSVSSFSENNNSSSSPIVVPDDTSTASCDETPTPASNLRDITRPVWIVTTAALPWMTGTAVNPLLRAAYLIQHRQRQQQAEENVKDDDVNSPAPVHLVVPWLASADDRVALYGPDWRHATQQDQAQYIRTWLSETAGIAHIPQLHFYPAAYHPALSSIFALGDVGTVLEAEDENGSILILEEPEHLNWYRAPAACRPTFGSTNFTHVIGICHTNYQYYAQQHLRVVAPAVTAVTAGVVRAYCDQIIKLSAVLQEYARYKECVCNVHGIRQDFLQQPRPVGNKVYFLGKLLWVKGLDQLLSLQAVYRERTGSYFVMDIYGSGLDEMEIQKAYLRSDDDAKQEERTRFRWTSKKTTAHKKPFPVRFCGRLDHAKVGPDYKIFVNPSVSEVLCTTTAEALAMGKFVVLPCHASNDFFSRLCQCLVLLDPPRICGAIAICAPQRPRPWTTTSARCHGRPPRNDCWMRQQYPPSKRRVDNHRKNRTPNWRLGIMKYSSPVLLPTSCAK